MYAYHTQTMRIKDHKKIIREKLLALVKDGEKHHITEIRQLDDNWDLTAEIMEELIAEDILLMMVAI